MPGAHRRGVLPRRRRRDDEAEDESSAAGDLDDSSVSEGSAPSNGQDEADGEGSEISAEDEDVRTSITETKASGDAGAGQSERTLAPTLTDGSKDPGARQESTLAAAASSVRPEMENENPDGSSQLRLRSDDRSDRAETTTAATGQLPDQPGTPSDRVRLEREEYIRQRNSNPAFVPNKGGFYFHDDRTAATSSPYGRPFQRGRGRGYNNGIGIGRGFSQAVSGPSDRQWSHDLHDTVNKSVTSPPARDTPSSFQIPTAKPAATAPNRTFSISTVLGNVTVQVFLPGMESKRTFQNVVKKQHTLLPQHRPPLRRDKPVRISIPDEDPRYIFPSAERSFIFIPRAMRPNQQIYTRGRGRGSFHGSRRPSVMGSTYTPSVGMSRKSSLGGAGSTGLLTPTDGSIPRGPMGQNFNRAIVRMPMAPMPGSGMQPPQGSMYPTTTTSNIMPFDQYAPGSAMLHSPPVILPIHQPRPQKSVSVADIESPAFKAPQQQQEQPFHQQMPLGVSLADGAAAQHAPAQPNLMMNTPLSHIPEGAVYAQPFQPYPMYPPGYYGAPFPGAPMMFNAPADPYAMGMGGPVMPQQFAPGPQSFAPTSQPGEQGSHQGPMAHESNGMVYYYDPAQFQADGSNISQYPTAIGGGMMDVQAPGPYFYPAMQGGMYFTPAAQ